MLTLVLTLALGTPPSNGPAPLEVAPVSFENLVRYSDLVVVGTVTQIETFASRARPKSRDDIDGLPPRRQFC